MLYEELFKLFRNTPEFEAFIPLETQPRYAVLGLIIALICIGTAVGSIPKNRSLGATDYVKFFLLSILGSLFFGMATVFLTNSFGVYA